MQPRVLHDPLAVIVEMVVAVEPALERAVVEDVVTGVARGRDKRRRIAQALVERPQLLSGGRSPAPRAIGDLLIALRRAGAARISAPVCAGCGKSLRTLQYRGQDWFCWRGGRRREPCASCGQVRPVKLRDRDGQPRCCHCPPEDLPDPLDIVVDVVTRLDPTLPAETVRAAAREAAPQRGRQQLARAVAERPELLTSAGAYAPVPAVLRLIDNLRLAGAVGIVRPPCPHCGRVMPLVRARGGVRLCSTCVSKSRAETCSRCNAQRAPATRDDHGQPICAKCLVADPANHETCVNCRRRRPVRTRTPDGSLCASCPPLKILTCSICGNTTSCVISRTTGGPWCRACQQRRVRCAGCGRVEPVRGGTRDQPLCSTCTRPDPEFWHSCPRCGQPGRIHSGGPCARCTIKERLQELLSDDNGEIRPQLLTLYHALAGTDRPETVTSWLARSTAPSILRSLRGQPLTHQALDELCPDMTVEHLRAMLVATGCLPPRDERLAHTERWITDTLAAREDPDQQQLLHRYAVWHLLRRLRGRLRGTDTTLHQAAGIRAQIKAAISLLDWLAAHDLTLDTAHQGDLETWLATANAAHRRDVGHFVRWAHKQKLTHLELPTIRWDGPSGAIDTETRWQQARRLMHDNSIKAEDRVAGLLVLLYAQQPATISRLTLDHLDIGEHHIRLRLGCEPVVLPEPLAGLVRQLAATRHGHAVLADPGTSPWLFPGGRPGQPISSEHLRARLRRLGLHPGQSRSTALFQLATDLPAALLARMLGIHITVAAAWQRASSGDWTSYAAEVSRRNP